jgi:hypothetical protein
MRMMIGGSNSQACPDPVTPPAYHSSPTPPSVAADLPVTAGPLSSPTLPLAKRIRMGRKDAESDSHLVMDAYAGFTRSLPIPAPATPINMDSQATTSPLRLSPQWHLSSSDSEPLSPIGTRRLNSEVGSEDDRSDTSGAQSPVSVACSDESSMEFHPPNAHEINMMLLNTSTIPYNPDRLSEGLGNMILAPEPGHIPHRTGSESGLKRMHSDSSSDSVSNTSMKQPERTRTRTNSTVATPDLSDPDESIQSVRREVITRKLSTKRHSGPRGGRGGGARKASRGARSTRK